MILQSERRIFFISFRIFRPQATAEEAPFENQCEQPHT